MLKPCVGLAFCFVIIAATSSLATVRQDKALQFPTFDAGDIAASVKSVDAVSSKLDVGALIWIEFANRSDLHVEPLEVQLNPKGRGSEPIELRRVEAPFYGRAGRAIPPRGKLRYPFLAAVEPKLLKGAKAEVLIASACTSAFELPETFVKVGKPKTTNEFDARWQKSLDRTTVALENQLDHAVDLAFEATYRQPQKATSLVRVRLEPREKRDFVIEGISNGSDFPLVMGADVNRLELVDWSVSCDDGGELARELLAEVWSNWHCLSRDLFPLTAQFDFEIENATLSERASGSLRVDADGKIELSPDGKTLSPDSVGAAQWLSRQIAAQLVRESFEELMRDNRVRIEAQGPTTFIRLERARFTGSNQPIVLGIRSGRIVSNSGAFRGSRLTDYWTVSSKRGPWRLTERGDQTASGEPDIDLLWRFDWKKVDGRELPTRVTVEGMGVRFLSQTNASLKLSKWDFATPPTQPNAIPSGALADELRKAWDAVYHYPDAEVVVAGHFRFDLPGNDDTWGGHEHVEGRFEVGGIEPNYWRDRAFTLEGAYSDSEREVLLNAVADRFLLWSGRDFHRQPTFDIAFAGASLSEAEGWIQIENGPVAAVKLSRGQLDQLRLRNGAVQELRLKRIGDHLMVVESELGRERIVTEWKSLDDKTLFPSSARFEDVFTTDDYKWGPEAVTWTDLELRKQ